MNIGSGEPMIRNASVNAATDPRTNPNLWFDTEGLEAAEFYVSVFPNSKITDISHYGEGGMREAGTVMTVDFVLDGQPFTAINGGPQFRFDEAVSFADGAATNT